jgi:hypothetical protein
VVGILAAIVLAGAPAHAQSVGLPGAGGEGADSSEAALQLADLEGQLARVQERLAEWRLQADGFEQIAAAAPARLIEIEDELTSIESAEPLALDSLSGSELEVQVLSAEQNLARVGPFARDSERFVIRLLIGGTEKPR